MFLVITVVFLRPTGMFLGSNDVFRDLKGLLTVFRESNGEFQRSYCVRGTLLYVPGT